MELYTSLTRLKMALNDGVLPPMTPLTESAKVLLDPAFTIGMGAFEEDADKGLRCPVRGCGKYFHVLSRHINAAHAEIGGSSAVRRALSIPSRPSLISRARARVLRDKMKPAFLASGGKRFVSGARSGPIEEKRRSRTGPGRRYAISSMGWRNLRDSCDAQLKHKLIDLQNTLGRSPSEPEAREMLGGDVVYAICRAFGTWNNAKGQCGMDAVARSGAAFLSPGRRSIDRTTVLEALSAWYDQHGTLPTTRSIKAPSRTPLMPDVRTICRAMGADSWPEAMRRAASLLNIYGGRYGLPPRKEVA